MVARVPFGIVTVQELPSAAKELETTPRTVGMEIEQEPKRTGGITYLPLYMAEE